MPRKRRSSPGSPSSSRARGRAAASASPAAVAVAAVVARGDGLDVEDEGKALAAPADALGVVSAAWLSVFALVAFSFEPTLVWCHVGYGGLLACAEREPGNVVAALWVFYAQSFDPVFLTTPTFLLVMVAIDWLVFGPSYAALLWALLSRNEAKPWVRALALVWLGAVVYSTLVYFAFEMIEEWHRINVPAVILINMPWTVVPPLAAWRILHPPPASSRKAIKTKTR